VLSDFRNDFLIADIRSAWHVPDLLANVSPLPAKLFTADSLGADENIDFRAGGEGNAANANFAAGFNNRRCLKRLHRLPPMYSLYPKAFVDRCFHF
jgi:hypothetical protein